MAGRHSQAYYTTWKMLGDKEYLGRHCVPAINDCGHFRVKSFIRRDESVRDLSRCDPDRQFLLVRDTLPTGCPNGRSPNSLPATIDG